MTEPSALLGSLLDEKYRVLEIIGRGGAATVLKAEDTKHQRLVAVKLFRSDVMQFGGPDRFAREIAILATLQHPNILPLLDSGLIDGQMYYVMPFVQGESLRERLGRDGKLPIPDAVRIMVEVCDALRYAHELGIVHRDVKPENVLLSGRHALVADFGIARSSTSSGDPRTTTAGIALGTPAYMAPEQAAADPDLDPRADLYAVGVLGFEMLAGRTPFSGHSPAAMLAAHVTEAPPRVTEFRDDTPPGLAAIIGRCLAKRPQDRWNTAAALTEQLETFLLPSGAVTPVATPARPRTGRRIAAGAALALAAALVGWGWIAGREPAVPALGAARRISPAAELELDPMLSPDGRLLTYASGRNGSLRIQVRQLEGGDPIEVAGSVGGNQRNPSWSADGSRVTFQAGGTIYQAPALGGRAAVLVEGGPADPADNAAWSPDRGHAGVHPRRRDPAPRRRRGRGSDHPGPGPGGPLTLVVAGRAPPRLRLRQPRLLPGRDPARQRGALDAEGDPGGGRPAHGGDRGHHPRGESGLGRRTNPALRLERGRDPRRLRPVARRQRPAAGRAQAAHHGTQRAFAPALGRPAEDHGGGPRPDLQRLVGRDG